MRRKHLTSKRKGVTLILALMVMSAVIAIGITIVAIVVFQTRINATTTQGQQGYYAAESGIEQALSKVVGLRSGSLAAAESALRTDSTPTNSPFLFNLDLTTAVSSGTVVQKELKQNQSTVVEIYNVDASVTTNLGTPGLCVYAESGDTTSDEVLEISWIGWLQTTGVVSATQRILVAHSQFSATSSCTIGTSTYNGFSVPLTQFYPAFPGTYAGFRVRITALVPEGTNANGDVSNLTINSFPQLNSHLRIKSTSRSAFTNQQQALLAVVPWSVPLSSLFDFVIFSERDLTKNLPQSKADEILRYGPYPAIVGSNLVGADQTSIDPLINPFTSCGTSECKYYVRVLYTAGYSGAVSLPSGGTSQNVVVPSGSGSCIIPNQYTISTSAPPPGINITFGGATGGVTYELLNNLTFRDPTEGYCPAS